MYSSLVPDLWILVTVWGSNDGEVANVEGVAEGMVDKGLFRGPLLELMAAGERVAVASADAIKLMRQGGSCPAKL